MTNNSRKHYGVSLCSCQCHHATAWLFKRHGDKHVSSTELRKRDNGGNVSYSCWITERKHCNELKAQQWLIQIQPLSFYLFIYLKKKKKGKAKPLLFFIFSRDQMVLQNHMITQMHLNKNTKTNPLTYASVACFWQWSCFAWGLLWLCGWLGNLGTSCCAWARNLLPLIARFKCCVNLNYWHSN